MTKLTQAQKNAILKTIATKQANGTPLTADEKKVLKNENARKRREDAKFGQAPKTEPVNDSAPETENVTQEEIPETTFEKVKRSSQERYSSLKGQIEDLKTLIKEQGGKQVTKKDLWKSAAATAATVIIAGLLGV